MFTNKQDYIAWLISSALIVCSFLFKEPASDLLQCLVIINNFKEKIKNEANLPCRVGIIRVIYLGFLQNGGREGKRLL